MTGIVKRIAKRIRDRRILRARADVAYWVGKAEIWGHICNTRHTAAERVRLADAFAEFKRHEARLEALLSKEGGG